MKYDIKRIFPERDEEFTELPFPWGLVMRVILGIVGLALLLLPLVAWWLAMDGGYG